MVNDLHEANALPVLVGQQIMLERHLSVTFSRSRNTLTSRVPLLAPVDIRQAYSAIHALWSQHPNLDVAFRFDGQWKQFFVHKQPQILELDLSAIPVPLQDEYFQVVVRELGDDLDFELGPLAVFVLVLLEGEVAEIWPVVHHMATDWSGLQNLIRDLKRLINGAELVKRPKSFGALAEAISRHADTQHVTRELDVWKSALSGSLATLPSRIDAADRSRYTILHTRRVSIRLTAEQRGRVLSHIAGVTGATLHTCILAALCWGLAPIFAGAILAHFAHNGRTISLSAEDRSFSSELLRSSGFLGFDAAVVVPAPTLTRDYLETVVAAASVFTDQGASWSLLRLSRHRDEFNALVEARGGTPQVGFNQIVVEDEGIPSSTDGVWKWSDPVSTNLFDRPTDTPRRSHGWSSPVDLRIFRGSKGLSIQLECFSALYPDDLVQRIVQGISEFLEL